jgi:hypothetical protein
MILVVCHYNYDQPRNTANLRSIVYIIYSSGNGGRLARNRMTSDCPPSCQCFVSPFLSVIPFSRIHTQFSCWSQAAVLVLFNLGCTLLVFPAVVSLDLRRRRSGRVDILCCCLPGGLTGSEWPCCTLPHVPPSHFMHVARRRRGQVVPEPAKKLQAITRALPPDRQQTVTVLAPQIAPMQTLTPVSVAPLCWYNKWEVYSIGMQICHMCSLQFYIHYWTWCIFIADINLILRYRFPVAELITLHILNCIVSKYFSLCFINHFFISKFLK